MKTIADRLTAAGVENPMRDARMLSEYFFGDELKQAIKRRESREPMSHILGYRVFWRDRFIVNADVLDPRPDSELFIELSRAHIAPQKVLDLGCGSGALGLSVLREFPDAHCLFADISEPAIEIAKQNAQKLGLMDRAEFVNSNWLDKISGRFNQILCNPPYIGVDEMPHLEPELQFEPKNALTDGADGLSIYRYLAQNITGYMDEGGVCFVEHGYEQQTDVANIFGIQGFLVRKYADLAKNPRICAIYRDN